MSQAAPLLPTTGTINVTASPRSQQRGQHGSFRYFGKLAPDVTGAVLDSAAELVQVTRPVVDVMCGSGTTLIEASDRGWSSIGLDVNPVARLYARVKTRAVNRTTYLSMLTDVLAGPSAQPDQVAATFAATCHATRWFTEEAMAILATLRVNIDALPVSSESDALRAALLGRVRRISNGSARTGRLFYDPGSAEPALDSFRTAARDLLERLPDRGLPATIKAADARATGLQESCTDLTFCHPPYFALYRYSSDVLRFEMEVGGYSRRDTNKQEIREGWKSGDLGNLDHYVTDLGLVAREALRITRPGGVFVLVASNSTLGDVQLPVIDRLAVEFEDAGWTAAVHLERTAHFGSANYHRSARTDKVIQQDHVLLYRAA